MATPSQLSTEEGLRDYLTAHGISPKSINLLTGGTANYVYRVTLSDNSTVIYKHAAPYLHSNSNFALDAGRMNYENLALESLPPQLLKTLPMSDVHIVNWYSYDKNSKVLCIEDGGNQNLKSAYADADLDIPKIGQELGKWVAALHISSAEAPLSLTGEQDLKANNPIAVAIYRYSYNNLHNALAKFNHDPALADTINEVYGSKIATDNECICHGDFWPGNVLVKADDAEPSRSKLAIVDWEMVRRGTGATDVGQFCAESFLLDRFKGEKGLLPKFLDAYIEARSADGALLGRQWAIRVIVHWAVHVAFWPTRVEWTDSEGTQKLVDIGVEVLVAVVNEDWDRLQRSELLRNAGHRWSEVCNRP